MLLYSLTSHLPANYERWTSSPEEKSSNELDLWQKSSGMMVPASCSYTPVTSRGICSAREVEGVTKLDLDTMDTSL